MHCNLRPLDLAQVVPGCNYEAYNALAVASLGLVSPGAAMANNGVTLFFP